MIKKARQICFFGLGKLLRQNFHQLVNLVGKSPDYVFDNDPNFWGKEFMGITCLSKTEFLQLCNDFDIYLTINSFNDVIKTYPELNPNFTFIVHFKKSEFKIEKIQSLQLRQIESRKVQTCLLNRKNEWCYISGSSRGIGYGIARYMAEAGLNVILHGTNSETLEQKRDELKKFNVSTIVLDHSFEHEDELYRQVDWIQKQSPKISLAYCNAAVSLPPDQGGFIDGSLEGWKRTFQINFFSQWLILRSLIGKMSKVKNAKIFLTSSAINDSPKELAYACSKFALNKMVTDIINGYDGSLSKSQPEICLMDPGWVKTEMGGSLAKYELSEILTGMVFPAFTSHSCHGSWITAHKYRNMTIEEAIREALVCGELSKNCH